MTEDPYWNVSNMLYGKFTSAVERRVYYPAVVQSGNRYVYAGGNPVRFYDPSGMCFFDKKGNWCHDNWEYTGGYTRREKPTINTTLSFSQRAQNEHMRTMNSLITRKAESEWIPITSVDDKGLNKIANMERNPGQIKHANGVIICVPLKGNDVGYGHDFKSNPLPESWIRDLSAEDALTLLRQDVNAIASPLKTLEANLTQDQFNALVTLRYNVGSIRKITGLTEYLEENTSYDRAEMREIIIGYYDSIIDKNPENEKHRAGWYSRTDAMLDLFFDGNYGNMSIDAVNGKVNES